jgi:CRP/FNR family transcriptional regulator, cyclic AMP receptor protein
MKARPEPVRSLPMDWPVLGRIPAEQRQLVMAAAIRRRYQRGSVIFHEGDPGDELHLIDLGRVAVRVSTADGEQATLRVLGPGDSFGELALVSADNRRSATVEALERTETLALGRGTFGDVADRHPSVHAVVIAILAHQVRDLSNSVLEALYTSAELRVLRRLCDLARVYGGDSPIDVPLTQDTVASMAGTTRPTANKVLRQAEEAGVVSLGRGHIMVHDLRALDRMAR